MLHHNDTFREGKEKEMYEALKSNDHHGIVKFLQFDIDEANNIGHTAKETNFDICDVND